MEQFTREAAVAPRTLKHIRNTAKRLARCRSVPGMDAADIEQDLVLDLWHRSHAFDPTKATFATFADRIIANRVATLTAPTLRSRAERHHVALDDYADGEEQQTLADTLADPSALSDVDQALSLDMKRFVAGLSPALQRCCAILLSPNRREASTEAGVHRSSVYESAHRLRKLAEAAGLREYISAPRHFDDRAGRCPA
jgi:DNA-directed RNA polymerase specialized sigma24 family protein